jgi:rubrerythrin
MKSNSTPQSLTEATVPVRKSGSPAVIAKSDLSQPEADLLQQLETVINRGKQAFIEVGTALMEIRVNRLYRGEFDTFEEYCQSKWGFTRNFAHMQIQSAEIASGLLTVVNIPNEGTAREFISVPAEDRPAVAEQAKAIAAEHGRDTINSRDVKEAKAKRKAGPVYHCAECRNTFTESDGDCPRCHPPEPETVEFVQAEDHDFELTFAVVCGSFSRRVFDARSHWTPDQVKRLKTEINAFFSCEVPPQYREAQS